MKSINYFNQLSYKMSKNKGLSLFVLNLLLLVLVFFVRDPFSLFVKSYKKSEAWLNQSQSITEIQIAKFSVQSGQAIQVYSQSIFLEENLSEKDELQKVWKMKMDDGIFILSTTKVDVLLDQIYDTRKFTKLGGDTSEYGYAKGYISLKIHTQDGNTFEWKLSEDVESTGGGYIQDETGGIYYLPFSMLHALGRFTPLYLVEKKLFPSEKEFSSLLSIHVQSPNKYGYSLGREGNDWFLLGQENRRINETKTELLLEQWKEIQAVVVHSQKEPSWKKIPERSIHLGIQENGLPKSLKLICNYQDREENFICSISDRAGYFAFSRFALEEVINKTNKDF